ncbi:MAG: DNA mismatch repair endonuclease MutL [Candidatus Rokuibacteriota bacterium]
MIRKLPESLINKIAAGEVVERPAAAVKELVENALDAGAGSISVDLRDGGSALVRVTDDGTGMTAPELPLALERHATSKLACDEDLAAIATLGFRGEALPAICAVSRFTITSRARGAAEGLRVAGEGGVITQRLSVPAEPGTTVEVRDLFFNTPARLKFLKSTTAETAATLRMVSALAAAHPDVQVRVVHNGRPAITAPHAADPRARLGALWGWEVARRLLLVERTEHGVHVQGLVAPPDLVRGNRDEVLLVVNGRPVRDPALVQAVLEAYRPLLPRDRYPLAAIHLRLDPAGVDVNVHPTKAVVRFRHPRLLHEMLVTAVREALGRREVVPEVRSSMPGPDASPSMRADTPAEQTGLFAEDMAAYTPALFGRVLGQVQDTFIVSTSEREVFFLDQHVAQERVLFERLQADLRRGPLASQTLLFADPLDVSPAAHTLLDRWREPLERLGFAFADSSGVLALTAVPILLKGEDPARLIEAAVDDLGAARAGVPALDRALAFVACRAAVKAETPLSREEMERIVSDLSLTTSPYFCPHGRPIVSRVSLSDIRRELRRTW